MSYVDSNGRAIPTVEKVVIRKDGTREPPVVYDVSDPSNPVVLTTPKVKSEEDK